MIQAYLIIVTPGPETRFDQEPEFLRGELQAFAERLVKLPPPIRISGPVWRLADLEAAEKAGRLPRPVST